MVAQNFERLMALYHSVFIYCGLAALVFMVMAVILFVLFKIPRVLGEFTGRTARKAIRGMAYGGSVTGGYVSRRPGEYVGTNQRGAGTRTIGTVWLRR